MKQKGFAPIVVLVVIASVVMSGIAIVRLQQSTNIPATETAQNPQPTTSPSPSVSPTTKTTPVSKPKVTQTPASKTATPPPTGGLTPTPLISSNPSNTPTPTSLSTPSINYNFLNCPKITVNAPDEKVFCQVVPDKTSGKAPLKVNLANGACFLGDIYGDGYTDYVDKVQWDFNGDNTWDTAYEAAYQQIDYTYSQSGKYTIRMHLKSKKGVESEICTMNVTVE